MFSPLTKQFKLHKKIYFQLSKQTLPYTALRFHPARRLLQDAEHIQLGGAEGVQQVGVLVRGSTGNR